MGSVSPMTCKVISGDGKGGGLSAGLGESFKSFSWSEGSWSCAIWGDWKRLAPAFQADPTAPAPAVTAPVIKSQEPWAHCPQGISSPPRGRIWGNAVTGCVAMSRKRARKIGTSFMMKRNKIFEDQCVSQGCEKSRKRSIHLVRVDVLNTYFSSSRTEMSMISSPSYDGYFCK